MSGKKLKQIVKIVQYGSHSPLFESKIEREIKKTTSSAITQVKKMAFKHKLVSLSANQIGLDQRLFVALKQEFMIPGKWNNYSPKSIDEYEAIVNPVEIESSEQSFILFEECPSFQGIIFKVEAPILIKVGYFSEDDLKKEKQKKLIGFQCRVWDHEIRHLEGLLPIYHEICKGEFFLKDEYKINGYNIQLFELMKKRQNIFNEKNTEKLREALNKKEGKQNIVI